MAKIPLGNFGFSAPEPVPGARIPPGAAVDMRGLERIGNAVADVGLESMEREARLEAARLILEGKAQMDAWRVDFDANPVGADAKRPRFESAGEDFRKFVGKLSRDIVGRARTPLAKNAIALDLQSYAQSSMGHVVTTAKKVRTDTAVAATFKAAEDALAVEGIDDVERMKRVTQSYASLVSAGQMGADDAERKIQEARRRLEYGRSFSAINGAATKEQLYELRGQLSRFNPLLSPEQNRDLVRLTNERIASLDKQAEQDLKDRQEKTEKFLTGKLIDGTLTIADVEAVQSSLPAATFERWAKAPELLRRKDAESADDPEIFRSVWKDIQSSARDPIKLGKLRDRVVELTTGYDRVTGNRGRPALSRDTAGRLLSDIDAYIREFRTEARTARSEASSQAERDFKSVQGLLDDYFKSEGRSRVGRAAQAELAERQLRANDDLLKNRTNAMQWWEGFKKANTDAPKETMRYPSWVVQPGGKADLMATRDKLTEDFKAKRLTRDEYQRRMDQLSEMETRRAP